MKIEFNKIKYNIMVAMYNISWKRTEKKISKSQSYLKSSYNSDEASDIKMRERHT